jgi:hypothetical protein
VPRRLYVVHLVRAANGLACLRNFASALRRHPPGTSCELVLAMKGFASAAQARPYLDEVADLQAQTLFFPDAGLDLGVYFAAAAQLEGDRYCFVNSFSAPLVDGWLAKLDAALDQPRAGLAGATGSWTSTRSWMAYSLRLPSAYRGALPPPAEVRRHLLSILPAQSDRGKLSARESLRLRAMTLRLLPEHEGFPAYHVRTNAFMISHGVIDRLGVGAIRDQLDTLSLESGRNSITRQVQRLGLRALVVDRSGTAFDHNRWDRSDTFWQGDQAGLLVSDNRTLLYDRADLELRRVLSGLTWGASARPTAPRREPETAERLG